jgi:hypothetical protein
MSVWKSTPGINGESGSPSAAPPEIHPRHQEAVPLAAQSRLPGKSVREVRESTRAQLQGVCRLVGKSHISLNLIL